MTRATKHRLPGMPCPNCQRPARQRKHRELSALVREVTFRCENDGCGLGFVVAMEAIRITQASANPRADLHLPFSPLPIRPTPANDDAPLERPPAANDTTAAMTG